MAKKDLRADMAIPPLPPVNQSLGVPLTRYYGSNPGVLAPGALTPAIDTAIPPLPPVDQTLGVPLTRFYASNPGVLSPVRADMAIPPLPPIDKSLGIPLAGLNGEQQESTAQTIVGGLFTLLSLGAVGSLFYHGYKRNDSVGWSLCWGLLGGIVWPITVPIAMAQGFAKPKVKSNPSRKRPSKKSGAKKRRA